MALIIVLQNISELADISDYRYQVLIGDGTSDRSHSIAGGTLQGHRRADGWLELVKLLLDANTPRVVDHDLKKLTKKRKKKS